MSPPAASCATLALVPSLFQHLELRHVHVAVAGDPRHAAGGPQAKGRGRADTHGDTELRRLVGCLRSGPRGRISNPAASPKVIDANGVLERPRRFDEVLKRDVASCEPHAALVLDPERPFVGTGVFADLEPSPDREQTSVRASGRR